LVFSSYFIGNPSSAFGHTLIRLNRAQIPQEGETFDLLDTGVNYAASITNTNPLYYVYGGLFGGFDGVFQSVPYYNKVREYNDFEARDLWEYDLNLSQDEVDMATAQFWELGYTRFPYWFLFKNCSYFLLAVIDAARPSQLPAFDLVKRSKFYNIPSDTLHTLYETPGLVRNLRYRPSARTLFEQRYQSLPDDEKRVFDEWLDHSKEIKPSENGNLILKGHPEAVQTRVLDVAIDYWDFEYRSELNKNPNKNNESTPYKTYRDILRDRSKLVSHPDAFKPVTPVEHDPGKSHESTRLKFSLLSEKLPEKFHDKFDQERSKGIGFGIRFALHDPLDDPRGYPEFGQIEFANFNFKLFRNKLMVDDLAIVRVTAMSPWTRYFMPISWKVRIGVTRETAPSCNGCAVGIVDGGVGLSFLLSKKLESIIGIFGIGGIEGSPRITTAYRAQSGTESGGLGPIDIFGGAQANLLIAPLRWLRVGAQLTQRYLVFAPIHSTMDMGGEIRIVPTKNFGVGVSSVTSKVSVNASLNAYYYY
jgi:hypothetical protein